MSNTKQMTRGQADTLIRQVVGEDYNECGGKAVITHEYVINKLLDAVHEHGPKFGQRMRAALVLLCQDAITIYREEWHALASNKYVQE